MARLPTPDGDDNTWGTILNDFLSVSLDSDGTLKPSSLQSSGVVQSTTPAGGDLTGTYPNPTINKLNGVTISNTAPSAGQVLTASNATNASWTAAGSGIATLPVVNVNITTLNQAVSPVAGAILRLVTQGAPWTANTVYDTTTTLLLGTDNNFYTGTVNGGLSGSAEPVWQVGGTVNDGPVIQWADLGPTVVPWVADTDAPSGTFIIGGAFVFENQGSDFTTGNTTPDWASAAGIYQMVADDGGQWTNVGPVSTWAPNTDYAIPANGGLFVIPTTPDDHVFLVAIQSGATSAESGSSTPTFNGGTVYDGDLTWNAIGESNINLSAGSDGEMTVVMLPPTTSSLTTMTVNSTVGVGAGTYLLLFYTAADSVWFYSQGA